MTSIENTISNESTLTLIDKADAAIEGTSPLVDFDPRGLLDQCDEGMIGSLLPLRIAKAAIEVETRGGLNLESITRIEIEQIRDAFRHASARLELAAAICAIGYQLFSRKSAA